MHHVVDLDQSIKFENTQQDTVLAIANGMRYAIRISRQVKRQCVGYLRAQGLTGKTFYFQLFAVIVFLLLHKHIHKLSKVYIDKEYQGHEGQIKSYIMNLFYRFGYVVDQEQIQFANIGKHSPAHYLALSIVRGDKKTNMIATTHDILEKFQAIKKSGPPVGRRT